MKLSEEMLNAEVTMTMREIQEFSLGMAKDVLIAVVGKMVETLREKPDQETTATIGEFAQLLENIVGDWDKMDLNEYLP